MANTTQVIHQYSLHEICIVFNFRMCIANTEQHHEGKVKPIESLPSDTDIDNFFVELEDYIPNIYSGIIAYIYEVGEYFVYMFTSSEAEEMFYESNMSENHYLL